MKATNFSVTVYGDNIEKFINQVGIPPQIEKTGGQLESCPTTGRKHYQGWVHCNGQQRASVILDWLPGVHVEKARNLAALKNYCKKNDTSEGNRELGKVNPDAEEYLTMDKALDKLAVYAPGDNDAPEDLNLNLKKIIEWQYWEAVKEILKEFPSQIGLYSQPQMYRAWVHTRSVWLGRANTIVLRSAPAENSNSLQETSGDLIDVEENLYD